MAKIEKKKLTLADLTPRPARIMLVHPQAGELDAWIEVTSSQHNAYVLKAIEINKLSTKEDFTAEDLLRVQAELTATCVVNWDESFFGMECTTENVVEVMSNMINLWIRDQVNEAIAENDRFFTKV